LEPGETAWTERFAGTDLAGVVDPRHEFGDLAGIYLPIGAAVVVLIMLLVVVFAFRYRARGDGEPRSRTSEAPKLEIAYVVLLACIAAFLLTRTFPTEAKVDRIEPHPGLVVHVIAAKWRWTFQYPRGRTTTNALVVPANTTVQFVLTSTDVIHSFWIPRERDKRDAFPGRIARFDMEFDKAGFWRYGGECSEFCGFGHTDMRFSVRALAPAAFRKWAAA
jgi:cytochrome c oxidase subunit II